MESESGISFTEFTYQLLQGYDFVHLARNHGVRMQVGVQLECAGVAQSGGDAPLFRAAQRAQHESFHLM